MNKNFNLSFNLDKSSKLQFKQIAWVDIEHVNMHSLDSSVEHDSHLQ